MSRVCGVISDRDVNIEDMVGGHGDLYSSYKEELSSWILLFRCALNGQLQVVRYDHNSY